MRGDRTAVDWYHHRIQEKRRRATSLTIEIGLNAQEKDDPSALVQTMERLDSAIRILEEAEAIVVAREELHHDITDDLCHSMEPLDLAQPSLVGAFRESLQFFG